MTAAKPRLGFVGLGWNACTRMNALVDAQVAEVIAVADFDLALAEEAAQAGDACACESLGALLEQRLDGVVIATPSALHAAHAMTALEHEKAVFCQEPLARTAAEAAQVVALAHATSGGLGARA